MTEPKKEKCEACCGSGYINFWTDDGHISMRTCRRCDGYGYIKAKPMTNEEYLRSANVNDMARCIATKLLELTRHEYGIYDVVDYATIFEWLKEKHE